MANDGAVTGSTWRVTPIATASKAISNFPTPGVIATTSSDAFNQDKPYDRFIKEQIAATMIRRWQQPGGPAPDHRTGNLWWRSGFFG